MPRMDIKTDQPKPSPWIQGVFSHNNLSGRKPESVPRPETEAKMIMGIADGDDFQLVWHPKAGTKNTASGRIEPEVLENEMPMKCRATTVTTYLG